MSPKIHGFLEAPRSRNLKKTPCPQKILLQIWDGHNFQCKLQCKTWRDSFSAAPKEVLMDILNLFPKLLKLVFFWLLKMLGLGLQNSQLRGVFRLDLWTHAYGHEIAMNGIKRASWRYTIFFGVYMSSNQRLALEIKGLHLPILHGSRWHGWFLFLEDHSS